MFTKFRSVVAICTERVEAKHFRPRLHTSSPRCNLHGACGGKAWHKSEGDPVQACCNLHGACGGKGPSYRRRRGRRSVAICTERVEAKVIVAACKGFQRGVAICTERVEAKFACPTPISRKNICCNLHGACGGKALEMDFYKADKTGCNLHGACGGKEPILPQSIIITAVAICTERVEAKAALYTLYRRLFVAICTERVEAKIVVGLIW